LLLWIKKQYINHIGYLKEKKGFYHGDRTPSFISEKRGIVMKKIKNKNHVRQSNYNIRRKPVLTLNEQRLYYTALAMVTEDDTIETEFQIDVKNFSNVFKLDVDGSYSEIKKATAVLQRKQFEKFEYNAKGQEISFERENLFYKSKYTQGDATASVWLGPTSLEFAKKKEGDKNYSVIVLNNIADLSSANSIRFYELMNMWKGLQKRRLPLTEFKDLLGLSHRYINNSTGFKNSVLKPCKDEINSKTNLIVRYDLIGAGKDRKIEFRIKEKEKMHHVSVEAESETETEAENNVKRISWDNLVIRRKDKKYLTLLNLVKSESPAAFFGDGPGTSKLKEDYLLHYLDLVEQILEEDSATDEASKQVMLNFLEIMLKNDYDHITPYGLICLDGFGEDAKKKATAAAFYQHNAIIAGIEKARIKKLEGKKKGSY
jgi:plasmid replication initiation protein